MTNYKEALIRKAKEEDCEQIFNLIVELAKNHNQTAYVRTNEPEIFDSEKKMGVIVAEIGSQLIGYLSYTWNYSIWSGNEHVNIDDVFILEEFRGQKVGKMLKANKIALENNISKIRWEVEIDNDSAIKFYESLGAKYLQKGIFKWNILS
ncbi:MAG: GNAT family N-acetyltransferase [Saonia sp.]